MSRERFTWYAVHALALTLGAFIVVVLHLWSVEDARGQEINRFNQERVKASNAQSQEIQKLRSDMVSSQAFAVALIEASKAEQAKAATEQTKLLSTIARQMTVTQQMALNAANVARHAEQRVDKLTPDIPGEIRPAIKGEIRKK